jgi:hypothetical protein
MVLDFTVMVQQYLYHVLNFMFKSNENRNMLVGWFGVTNNNFLKENICQQLCVLYVTCLYK